MYEKMLNKADVPSEEDIYATIGKMHKSYLEQLEMFLNSSYKINRELKFPFGNKYGWGYKYSHQSKHLFYLIFEKNAFTILIQIGKNEVQQFINKLDSFSVNTKMVWDNRYPCGDGGWLYYRVLSKEDLYDVFEIINIKKKPL